MRADLTLVRIVALYGPILVAVSLACWRPPNRRTCGAALIATLWNVPALYAVHLVSVQREWWTFQPVAGAVDGFPADLWLGWAVLWGAVPVLAPRLPLPVLVAVAVWADIVLMPLGAPVLRLGPDWWQGEAAAVLIALVPGVLLGRWMADDRRLPARAALQAVCFAALTFGACIRVAGVPDWSAVQWLALPGAVALAGVTEFVTRGGGTPFPYDPPRRLVTSGPYAYVANPMQLGMVVTLLGWAAVVGSWTVAAGAVLCAAFAAGFAAWHEGAQLTERYGEPWPAYRRAVHSWVPRWRPHVTSEATLHAGLACDVCAPIARWITGLDPQGLRIVDAADWPGEPLRRITYVAADGYRAEGVVAVSRALDHTNLAWAFAGWLLRLPGIPMVAQLLLDATGAGPRTVGPETFRRPMQPRG